MSHQQNLVAMVIAKFKVASKGSMFNWFKYILELACTHIQLVKTTIFNWIWYFCEYLKSELNQSQLIIDKFIRDMEGFNNVNSTFKEAIKM